MFCVSEQLEQHDKEAEVLVQLIDTVSGAPIEPTLEALVQCNGLSKLAAVIKENNSRASLQINHAGRYAAIQPEPVAPSAVETSGRRSKALTTVEI